MVQIVHDGQNPQDARDEDEKGPVLRGRHLAHWHCAGRHLSAFLGLHTDGRIPDPHDSAEIPPCDRVCQKPERHCEVNDIGHTGPGGLWFEQVFMSEGGKRSVNHLVHEPVRRVEFCDPGRHPPEDTKVASLPADLLTLADQA